MFGHGSLPRLYEDEPKRGIVLLVPWMLFGTIWLGLSTTLPPTTVDFYFGLLVAGSLALIFVYIFDRSVADELSELKLFPFVLFFGIAMTGVFVGFSVIRLLTTGTYEVNQYQPTQFANYLTLTILIVAPVETLVFQYVLPKMSSMALKGAKLSLLGGIAAQGTFAGFHYAAYSQDVVSMGFAFMLGIGFYALVKMSPVWGLGAAIGAHAGWNISIALLNPDYYSGALGGLV
jgi:hypothetical protein